MNLLCGANTLDQNSDTLYQYDEGQRAHTIKFMSNQIKNQTDLNKVNTINNINNLKLEIPKNSVNAYNNKEKNLNKNKSPKDSNKCSNNASELEIIEYPMKECDKSDFKNLNDILISQAKDYIYDKTQNDIIDYLKGKKGLNYLSLFFENDKDKDKDNNDDENDNDNDNDNNDSSKSDEIICSYIEIDRNNNSLLNKMHKEKSVIQKSSFSKVHKSSYSDCSLILKNHDTNTAKNFSKPVNTIESISKNNKEEKKISKPKKNININSKTDLKFKKILNHTLTPNYKTFTSKNKKLYKKEKEREIDKDKNKESDKTTLATEEKNQQKTPHINNSNKKKNIEDKRKKFKTFRSIESLNNINKINPISKEKKYINKNKKSIGKSKFLQFERYKPNNCTIENNINSIDKNYSQFTQIYKSIKGISSNNKKRKIYHKNKMTMTMNNNMLFNSINVKGNKKFNKGNFLSLKKSLLNTMRIDSKNKTKNENSSTVNSKLKMRKLLINNNQKNSKHKCDLSMYNINCLSNNCTITIKKGKNKALSKIMNKSEANKQFNNTLKLKGTNNNDFRPNKNLYMNSSISKILK